MKFFLLRLKYYLFEFLLNLYKGKYKNKNKNKKIKIKIKMKYWNKFSQNFGAFFFLKKKLIFIYLLYLMSIINFYIILMKILFFYIMKIINSIN